MARKIKQTKATGKTDMSGEELNRFFHGSSNALPFKAKTKEEFRRETASLNTVDLQAKAIQLDIKPVNDRKQLLKRMENEYFKRLSVSSSEAKRKKNTDQVKKLDAKKQEELAEIMRDLRV